jgi:hypothetical protein
LKTLADFEHEHKFPLPEPLARQRGVPVRGFGVPPWASPVERADSGPLRVQHELAQFLPAGASAFPLSPLAAPEFAPHPDIEFLEDDFPSASAVAFRPAPQSGVEIFSDEANPRLRPRAPVRPSLPNECALPGAPKKTRGG